MIADDLPPIPDPKAYLTWREVAADTTPLWAITWFKKTYQFALYWQTPEFENQGSVDDREQFRGMVARRDVGIAARTLAMCCLHHDIPLRDEWLSDVTLTSLHPDRPLPEEVRRMLAVWCLAMLAVSMRVEAKSPAAETDRERSAVRVVAVTEGVEQPADEDREALERAAIAALLAHGPNMTKIAEVVGKPRSTLYGWGRLMTRYEQAKQDAELNKGKYRGRRDRGDDYFRPSGGEE